MKLCALFEANVVDQYVKKFTTEYRSASEVQYVVDKFIEFRNAHRITGPEKDLGYWMSKSFKQLENLIDELDSTPSKKIEKKLEKATAIKVLDTPRFLITIPLTQEASCRYGKGTSWCISGNHYNEFKFYFNNDKYTIFIVIDKSVDPIEQDTNSKYAVIYWNAGYSIYDESDEGVEEDVFYDATGLSWNDFHMWHEKNKERITYYQRLQ